MHLRCALFSAGLALWLCGCMLADSGADKKIGETVHSLNDQARWGRIADAALLVEPTYQKTFLDQHRRWGSDIQLADTEVVNIQLAHGAEHASATVTYSWYAMTDMTLRETTLRQLWNAHDGGFVLGSESVVAGDPALLRGSEPSGPPPLPH